MAKMKVSRLKITKKAQKTILVTLFQSLEFLASAQGQQIGGKRGSPSDLLQQRLQHLHTSGHEQNHRTIKRMPTMKGAMKGIKLRA
mmetsp:Transcript_39518/g.94906  ORF Transcript_39518/g.94906 Transcript_39518/m.94906 type:complete len:86 (-) Transcript_39518:482-739(-)